MKHIKQNEQKLHIQKSCAWCGTCLNDVPPKVKVVVSHGICPSCREHAMSEFQEKLIVNA